LIGGQRSSRSLLASASTSRLFMYVRRRPNATALEVVRGVKSENGVYVFGPDSHKPKSVLRPASGGEVHGDYVVHFSMTTAQFRRWLKAEIRWLQAHETADEEQIFYDAAGILVEARQKATALGLPEAADLCRCRAKAVAPITAQESLAAVLGALRAQKRPSTEKHLTPPQVAKRYGVSPATVRGWIESGELKATNIASKGKRPMHRITPDALAEFDAKRGKLTPPPGNRRPKVQTIVSRY
jgi:hypothetical protein